MNKEQWIKCTKCNNPIEPVFPEDNAYLEQINNGVKLIFGGGYGMFRDNLGGNPTAFLCHDCVVELLEFFPQSFKDKFKGSHSYEHKSDALCCDYAWEFDDTPIDFIPKVDE